MTPARARFDTALKAAKGWHAAIPELSRFCAWPDDLSFAPRAPFALPAARLIRTHPGAPNARSTALLKALQGIAEDVEWRHTYTVDQLGQRFLDTYGWFELAGPEGHFLTHQARITVGYWGPELSYPRHQHGPEEMYSIVSGKAIFHADGAKDALRSPGQTQHHAPDQPHAMTTQEHPILTLVFWRGDGLAEMPRLTA